MLRIALQAGQLRVTGYQPQFDKPPPSVVICYQPQKTQRGGMTMHEVTVEVLGLPITFTYPGDTEAELVDSNRFPNLTPDGKVLVLDGTTRAVVFEKSGNLVLARPASSEITYTARGVATMVGAKVPLERSQRGPIKIRVMKGSTGYHLNFSN